MANKKRSIIFLGTTLLVGVLLALAGSWQGIDFQGVPLFALCVLLAFAMQWLMFVPAYIWQTERYYDLTGSLTYLSVMALALWGSGKTDPVSILLAVLVGVWALRLGSFLFVRILQDGSDHRFDAIKPNFLRFFAAWTIQGLWVSFTSAAALAAITSTAESDLGLAGWIGLIIWVLGFALEVVADRQKRQFRANPENAGQFIQTGLWSVSRHPNYFGEILLWVGVAIIAAPMLSGWQYLCLISPLFVTLLLTRVSGIPMLEATADERWQGQPEYEDYKARTPVLIPRF
ncbi:MAG: DUF1295 domain-containing protein [Candidatus Pelagadaptatus aseana]|uniref:DUF1295 domain-containing protein n=1 Tax=Candidatus Pelagadaptatus aseana TaxID=3120508 RepID=UPI0039B270C6